MVVEIWMPIIGGGILITTQSFWQSLGQFSLFEFGLCSHSTLLVLNHSYLQSSALAS
jgi:hypothetical protein